MTDGTHYSVAMAEWERLQRELKRLRERDGILCRLEAAGVDNWEGYSTAFDDEDEEDDDE
jgi:hypothetical protein